jgi:hypothetical protein
LETEGLHGSFRSREAALLRERPPRSLRSRLPLTRGRLRRSNESFILPLSVRGRAAEGGRGSLTHHLESGRRPGYRTASGKTSVGFSAYRFILSVRLAPAPGARLRVKLELLTENVSPWA